MIRRNGGSLTNAGNNGEYKFPEEIWEKILEEVLSISEDGLTCSKVSLKFQRILHPKRTTFLFPQIFPLLHPYLQESDLLACRMVCRAWRLVMDTGLVPSWKLEDVFDQNDLFPFGNSYIFASFTKMYKLAARFWNLHREDNPFISRTVEFSDTDYENARNFWDMVLVILSRFGQHIFCCTLRFGCTTGGNSFLQFLAGSVLHRVLNQMPNLKSLGLFFNQDSFLELYTDKTRWLSNVSRFENQRRKHTPSQRPKKVLESLCIPLLPLPLMKLVFAAVEPSQLIILNKMEYAEDPTNTFDGPSSNLDLLKAVYCAPELASTSSLVSLYGGNSAFAPHLTELHIHDVVLNSDSSKNPITFPGLIQALNSLSSLENLCLKVNGKAEIKSGSKLEAYLHLERLKGLAIETFNGIIIKGVDFIKELKSLELLRLRITRFGRWSSRREDIQLSGYVHQMHESNVWELLPNLKVVVLLDDDITKGKELFYKRRSSKEEIATIR